MHDLLTNAWGLVERAHIAGQVGAMITADQSQSLAHSLRGQIPQWFLELIAEAPLAGLSFSFGTPDKDGYRPFDLIWSTPDAIASESLEGYPGLAVLDRGFCNFALDASGGGDPFFLRDDASGDPPVWQIRHDISDDPDEIWAHGLIEVAPSFSQLMAGAQFG